MSNEIKELTERLNTRFYPYKFSLRVGDLAIMLVYYEKCGKFKQMRTKFDFLPFTWQKVKRMAKKIVDERDECKI